MNNQKKHFPRDRPQGMWGLALILSESFVHFFLLPVTNCISPPNYQIRCVGGNWTWAFWPGNVTVQDLCGCCYYFLLILASVVGNLFFFFFSFPLMSLLLELPNDTKACLKRSQGSKPFFLPHYLWIYLAGEKAFWLKYFSTPEPIASYTAPSCYLHEVIHHGWRWLSIFSSHCLLLSAHLLRG